MLNEVVADGLTNLPKLYGDNSVREKRKVHDLKSGVEAGGQVCACVQLSLLHICSR